jgi:FkbH-like protein
MTEAVLYRILHPDPAARRQAAAEYFSKSQAPFQSEIVDRILSELTRPPSGDSTAELLSWAENLPVNPQTAYACAKLAAECDHPARSLPHWERLLQLTSDRDPFVLLAFIKLLRDAGRLDEAALHLRRSLSPPPRYAFFPKADKLAADLASRTETHLRQCRIAILGASTTVLLTPVLRTLCFRDRIRAEFYEGLYGSVDQEILDAASGLASFRPDIVILLAHWRSLQLPAISEEEGARVDKIAAAQSARWKRLHETFGCHIIQQAFDFPAAEAHGYLANSLPGGRRRMIRLLNLRLQEAAGSHASILDTPLLQCAAGMHWQDQSQWYNFQQHPSTESLPMLADALTAHLRAVLGLTRKVLVTDLDNTLWKGVVGEDGLEGIKIGPGSPQGEAHAALQQYLLDLKSRGILLAVASKNNPEDACSPFQQHPHMLLRMEDFAAFEANWNDKAASLREIARKLSLGLDSFVFLDDNPLEREWVRSQLPEVAVVELRPSVFDYVADLDRGRYFEALTLSAEDRARAEQYRSEAARKHLQATSQSLDEFLAQLQLRATDAPITAKNLARAAQLTNKTNQFNLTTRRYTEAQVLKLAEDPAGWTRAFHLSDRMGDYGLIGVIFCRPAQSRQWEIDTWLMSCRVLGRQMEKFMFDRLVDAARLHGIQEIVAVYRRTPKNGLVREHYLKLGFTKIDEGSEESRYRLAVPREVVRTATHISSETEAVAVPGD